jgi:hypothetical protein
MTDIAKVNPKIRILIFTPDYLKGDSMRYRIIDSQFVKYMYLVTHFTPVEFLTPAL